MFNVTTFTFFRWTEWENEFPEEVSVVWIYPGDQQLNVASPQISEAYATMDKEPQTLLGRIESQRQQ